jgi:hypothetical protein
MKCRALGFFSLVLVGVCSGQIPTLPDHYIEIKLPTEVSSEDFFARYIFQGQDFGDRIPPRAGVSSYVLSTVIEGRLAAGIKAIFYAPGCAVQTLDVSLSDSDNPHYSFDCQPVKNVSIYGAVIRRDRLYGLDVKLQAKYVARWAQKFLGLDPGIGMSFPVGDAAALSADGRFRLEVPDLSQVARYPAELQIWAEDKNSGAVVAKLMPMDPQPFESQTGSLKIQNQYRSEIVFSPCAEMPPRRDSRGFAMRPAPSEACDH